MKTKILRPTKRNIKRVCKQLNQNELIGLPTETVYGLGANAFSDEAVSKIFLAKNRPQDNPLIVHVHKSYDLTKLVTKIPMNAIKLMKKFMPGPLTLVLESKGTVSQLVSRGLNTIAIRMPDHPVAISLLKECNLPLAAPSANISTRMSATTAKSVKEELNGKLKYILNGGTSHVGIESTVVDVTGDVPIILRPGKITKEQIKKICGDCEEVKKLKQNQKVASPGMKYKHYSPSCEVEIVTDLKEQYMKAINNGLRPVVMGLNSDLNQLRAVNKISLGDTVEDYAKNLYNALRKAEKNYGFILIYKVRAQGLGKAIMNRVNKIVK